MNYSDGYGLEFGSPFFGTILKWTCDALFSKFRNLEIRFQSLFFYHLGYTVPFDQIKILVSRHSPLYDWGFLSPPHSSGMLTVESPTPN
jgi:DNA polymerase sigma